MWTYRALFAFDALVLLVLVYFFFDGLQYADSGASRAIWFPVLAVPIGVLAGAWALQDKGKNTLAVILLAIFAVPPALFGLFMGLIVVTNPHWQ